MANATMLPVLSVDYTVAPRGKWNTVTDQVIAVYQSLLKEGYAPHCIGIFGESAGGGLTAGATLKIRDQGLPLPAVLVLWSPWADISATGDTTVTLADADPIINNASLQASADAYAPRSEQRNPYVSPVYGDYSKSFPPTLIQGGTKEIFLSHFVRLNQAMEDAGRDVKLDLYEGMPHIFQVLGAESPEAKSAVQKSAKFLLKYLGDANIGTPRDKCAKK
jgi:acetyl esterase/lipase